MKRYIQRWRDRQLKKWCLQQAIKIHDFDEDVIKAATMFHNWLKADNA